MKDLGFSADTIYNTFSRGRSNFLSRLVKAGIIDEEKGNYRVIDREIANAVKEMSSLTSSPLGRGVTTSEDEGA